MKIAAVAAFLSLLVAGCAGAQPQEAAAVNDSFIVDSTEEARLKEVVANGGPKAAEAAFQLSLHYSSKGERNEDGYWTKVAAENGHAVAQYNLWVMMRDSDSCEELRAAQGWLERSANSGFASAREKLEKFNQRVASCK